VILQKKRRTLRGKTGMRRNMVGDILFSILMQGTAQIEMQRS
jgi:hypothetical protein